MENNMKYFDIFCTLILSDIYKKFPLCITISANDIVERFDTEIQNTLDMKLKKMLFSETMYWLTNNEFISYNHPKFTRPAGTLISEEFLCVTLSLKGLGLVKSPIPNTLKEKSVGEEVLSNLKDGAISAAAETLVSAIINKAINI